MPYTSPPAPLVTLAGNTSGTLTLVSTGTLTLAGGANITLSQVGNAVSISAPNVAGAQTGISSIQASDATFTSGKVILTGVGGGITVSSNTGQRVDLSVAAPVAQSVQTQNMVDLSLAGNTSGTLTIVSSGTAILAGGNNITLSQNGQSITISAFTQTVQTQNNVDLSLAGNTTGTLTIISSGTGILAGGNRITLSQNGQSVTISGANAQTAISGLVGSDATYTSGTVSITGVGGGVTVNSNTGQRIDISVAAPVAQTAQTQSNIQAVVPLGNTAGTTGSVQTGTLGLAGGSNITISQSSGTASTNLSIIGVAAQTVQTQNNVDWSVSTTAGGGTAGTMALISSGTVSLFAGNNITISQSGGNTLVISGPNTVAQSVQTQNFCAMTLNSAAGGASTGTMALITSGTMSLYAGNGLSFSQAGNAVTAGQMLASRYAHNSVAGLAGITTNNIINTSVSVVYMPVPEPIAFTRVDVPINVSLATSATTNTAAIDLSCILVIYTANGSTLNPVVGVTTQTTWTWASNSGVYTNLTGPRLSSFALQSTLMPGDYWVAIQSSTHSGSSIGLSTTSLSGTFAPYQGSLIAAWTGTAFADMNAATAASVNSVWPFQGVQSVSISATGQTLQLSNITVTGTAMVRANPMIVLRNS